MELQEAYSQWECLIKRNSIYEKKISVTIIITTIIYSILYIKSTSKNLDLIFFIAYIIHILYVSFRLFKINKEKLNMLKDLIEIKNRNKNIKDFEEIIGKINELENKHFSLHKNKN